MYKGPFKFKNANGTVLSYKKGDTVNHQGKVFMCKKNTSKSPLQDKNSWTATGFTEPFFGSSPPIKPIQNQLWVSDSGKTYVYYKDQNTFQWVEI